MHSLLGFLSAIGRFGTQALAASLFVGLLLPPLAAAARPFLPVTIIVFVTTTFMRVDLARVRRCLERPVVLGLALTFVAFAPAAIVATAMALAPRGSLDPGLLLGLAIQVAAPPIMSSPTVALLLRVEPALIFSTVLTLTVLAPILSPVVADAVAGAAVPLDTGILLWRLVSLIGGALVLAIVLRRLVGFERIVRHGSAIDGIGVAMYAVFALAAMDGVLSALLSEPGRVALYLCCALACSAAGFAAAWVLLQPVPKAERLVLGYATGQRNMGVLIAALGASAPPSTYLYFALAQFPIYLAPQIIRPLAARLTAAPGDARRKAVPR